MNSAILPTMSQNPVVFILGNRISNDITAGIGMADHANHVATHQLAETTPKPKMQLYGSNN